MSVIQLRPRKVRRQASDLEAVDKALRDTFTELALQHGGYAVTTAAHGLVCEVIKAARSRQRPNEEAWVLDLETSFQRALGRPRKT